MNKRVSVFAFSITFFLALWSVSSQSFALEKGTERDKYFVSAEYVNDNLDKLKIIDARDDKAYLLGHISGALVTSWQSLSNMDGKPGDKNWGTLAENKVLEKKIQALGLNSQDEIVVYSDTPKGWGEDGRLAWSLRAAGLDNVRILDGGYQYWKEKDYSTSIGMGLSSAPDSAFRISQRDNSLTLDTQTLQKNYSQYQLIDTRTEAEFKGAIQYGEARGGHLPGAVNIPFTRLLNKDGTLKSNQEIEAIMTEAGIRKDRPIVTYCTAGIRSAHMALALKAAGYQNVKNYDQSYYRWAALSDQPVEQD